MWILTLPVWLFDEFPGRCIAAIVLAVVGVAGLAIAVLEMIR